MGTTTILEIGADPVYMEEFRKINDDLPALEEELEAATQTINVLTRRMKTGERLSADKAKKLEEARNAKEVLEKQIQYFLSRMDDLEEIAGMQSGGCIRVSGIIYPGCKVMIYNTPYHIRSELKYCRLIKDRADVKMVEY